MKFDMLKIFGERNVGTNYLLALIGANTDTPLLRGVAPKYVTRLQALLPGNEWLRDWWCERTFPENLGWKHSFVDPARLVEAQGSRNIGFIAIVKNPYSWLLSLYRRPYHRSSGASASFEDFLRAPWAAVKRELMDDVANPIELWNRKCGAYKVLQNRLPTVLLRYEDLVAAPEIAIEQICSAFNLERKPFRNVEASTKRDRGKDFAYYRDYYLQERWREKLSPEAIAIINGALDGSLRAYFGYEEIAVEGSGFGLEQRSSN